jgi:A/G-specific adenine glycosylase
MKKIQKLVLSWYKNHGRQLPWRETKDPYKILVSEIMLQQTQVDRVIPKYYAFLDKFPTPIELAQSSKADVLKLWSGLGYNRRALYLHKCAQEIKDGFPKDYNQLIKLSGIGPYTASAILSFSFNENITVIDVNIERIFKRIFYNEFDNIQELANTILPLGQTRDWHNALMDIGAQFCKARNPKCENCPINAICISANDSEKIKKTWKKKKVKPFKESNRIVRGEILKLLTKKENIEIKEVIKHLKEKSINRDKEKFLKIIEELEKDKLLKNLNGFLFLP